MFPSLFHSSLRHLMILIIVPHLVCGTITLSIPTSDSGTVPAGIGVPVQWTRQSTDPTQFRIQTIFPADRRIPVRSLASLQENGLSGVVSLVFDVEGPQQLVAVDSQNLETLATGNTFTVVGSSEIASKSSSASSSASPLSVNNNSVPEPTSDSPPAPSNHSPGSSTLHHTALIVGLTIGSIFCLVSTIICAIVLRRRWRIRREVLDPFSVMAQNLPSLHQYDKPTETSSPAYVVGSVLTAHEHTVELRESPINPIDMYVPSENTSRRASASTLVSPRDESNSTAGVETTTTVLAENTRLRAEVQWLRESRQEWDESPPPAYHETE
ncbi:hypothetical protein Hypma_010498 [Hypsizygus marmoreus]|uniref:Mid2 domain-containing protein n=1 Tax=Hypsizygus marmoreus TaxID=39966 RepID=A0A369JJD4_HYPMA|nr:hypothetical protein Hypma_010498 [Hypsizygus marmoreus]